MNYIAEYYAAIAAGKEIVGVFVKRVYQYVLHRLNIGEVFFNAQKAERAVQFIETFVHHHEGGQGLLKLELWQKAAISLIFGVVDAEGLRVFQEVLIVIGRKNGKSLLAAAIMEYTAFCDGEYGGKIYCLAPKLDQARIVYDGFYKSLQQEPELTALAKKRRSDIYLAHNNTEIKPLAFNSKQSDGYNPSLVVCDEIASWRGDAGLKQYEVMKSGFGARKQPLMLSISTAGYENGSTYDELILRAKSLLDNWDKPPQEGRELERRYLPLLYIIDDVTKWDDIDELKKANPNMGVSVRKSFFIDEIVIAKQSLSKRVEFLVKYCNVKQNSSLAWLSYEEVERCATPGLSLEDFRGCYCIGGVDLSRTTDLTAASIVIERDDVINVWTQFFMHRGRIEAATDEDGIPYQRFVEEGVLTLSGDGHVDYRDVLDWFKTIIEQYELTMLVIGYDKYSATYLVDDLKREGWLVDDVRQGENLSPVIDEFKGLIEAGKIRYPDNALLRAHLLNVALKHNAKNPARVCPIKCDNTPTSRIDGFMSIIDALTVRMKYTDAFAWRLKNEE